MEFLSNILAKNFGSVRFETAPRPVQERLQFAILDTLAVLISGATRSDVSKLRQSLPTGSGACTLIGLGGKSVPSVAAYSNALPIASEQLQDGHRAAKGHPMSHLLPSVLAIAEAEGASGLDFLSALLVGYEISVRVGLLMSGTPSGVHDIGTFARIGSSCAVTHLLTGGSPSALANAVELCSALLLAFDAESVFNGASVQHLFLAASCQSAVDTGYAASVGISADEGTFERFYFPRISKDQIASKMSESEVLSSSNSYEILNGYHKLHPTCAHLHGVNDATEIITGGVALDPDLIESVVVEVYAEASEFSSPYPKNDLDARFSIPFTVAVTLLRGKLYLDSFGEYWLTNSSVRLVSAKVSVVHDETLDVGYPAGRPARVTVQLKDGEVRTALSTIPRGDGISAMEDDEVLDKPANLMEKVVGQRIAVRLFEGVNKLKTDNIGCLSEALELIPLLGYKAKVGSP